MSLKQDVLQILEDSNGKSISGEEMAGSLHVSRNAVWKAVNALKADGIEISSGTNKGYCLKADADLLTEQGIRKFLNYSRRELTIKIEDCVTSTNTRLKERAEAFGEEGEILIAKEQTAGKGRRGRSFYSPKSGSIYMSILLRPTFKIEQALFITTAAAVAVASAIEAVAGIKTGIKWVNDIFIGEKKVCGILTEAAVDMETGFPSYAVLGIGINIYPSKEGMPAELKEIAGTVFEHVNAGGKDFTNRLTASILNRFFEAYDKLPEVSFMEEYRRRMFLTGREVIYTSGNVEQRVTVLGVDDAAGLLVETENGNKLVLDSGEVSIKNVKTNKESR